MITKREKLKQRFDLILVLIALLIFTFLIFSGCGVSKLNVKKDSVVRVTILFKTTDFKLDRDLGGGYWSAWDLNRGTYVVRMHIGSNAKTVE